MKLEEHTAFSAVISGGLYSVTRSWELAFACLMSGIFIDLDHIIDYLIEYGRPFKVKKFFRVCYAGKLQKARLILHGWEWVFFLFIFSWLTGWDLWITGVLIGFGHHIVLDSFSNGAHTWSYFLFWRWRNDFDHQVCFPGFAQQQKVKDNSLSTSFHKE
ncbi:MAG: hypothetical protein HZB61_13020 [Nitrospirae bacterium]|nr:hypothetical protein [Nitrospirota bacterium]